MRWRPPHAIHADIFLRAQVTLLLVFLAQGIYFITANSETFDESPHIAAGYSYLATRDFRLDPEHPPLTKEIEALPLFLFTGLPFTPDPQLWREQDSYAIGQEFLYHSAISADYMLMLCRLPNLFLGAVLIALIGWWAYRLWGRGAAALAVALGCFEPNFVAHASLVTTDTGVALFIFSTLYLLWEYANSPAWWRLAAAGFSLGLALVSKYSALILFPILGLIVIASVLSPDDTYFPLPMARRQSNRPRRRPFETAVVLVLLSIFAFALVPAAYLFHDFSAWWKGLETFTAHAESGHPAFFLSQHSYDGWWNYFIVAFLIKTPIGSLVLIAASLGLYRAGAPLCRREAIFLLLPVAVFFLATTQAKVNIGLRHILAVYPFLFVVASRTATIRVDPRWLAPLLVAVMPVFTAASSLQVAPHQLAYFNEFVGGPGQGYRYLSDSNLDWGQDLKGLKNYLKRQHLPIIYLSYFGVAAPEYYGIRYQYAPGTWPLKWPPPADKVPADAPRKVLAISVYNLQDVAKPEVPLFDWLWSRAPIAKIGYSIFVYDLTRDEEGLAKLGQAYIKAGIPQLR